LIKYGEVESVSVDGDEDYSPDRWYPNEVEVIITYHNFPKEDGVANSNSEKTEEKNPENIDSEDKTESEPENSDDNNSEMNKTEKENIYEKGYRVRFNDYDICYLIDEDEKIISIFDTTEEFTDVYTTNYVGDLNNGIDFEWYGLKLRAHYKYVDQDATIIINDESGNENKALNLGVDIIEGYIKMRPSDN